MSKLLVSTPGAVEYTSLCRRPTQTVGCSPGSEVLAEMAVGFRLDVQEADHVKDREQRRARQEAYRRELNSQVADSEARRELLARHIQELEERHELKSVRTTAKSNDMQGKLVVDCCGFPTCSPAELKLERLFGQ